MSSIISIIVALLVFTILIVVHEYGHFLAARKCGVPVEEFSIGMGPAIYQRQGKKTLFSIRCLPIGGYCKMTGEEESSENPDAFCNKGVWQKILIVVAGATFNIIFAVIVLMILSNFSKVATKDISSVQENSPAYIAGIEENDKIIGLNGKKYSLMEDIIFDLTVSKNENNSIDLMIERNGEILNVPVNYSPVILIDDTGDYQGEVLSADSKIESINGTAIKDIKDIKKTINESKTSLSALNNSQEIENGVAENGKTSEEISENEVYDVVVKLYGQEDEIALSQDDVEILKLNSANRSNYLGIGLSYTKLNPLQAIGYGLSKTRYYITTTYKSFALMFSGKVSKDQIAGPVGIVKMFGDSYQKGLAVSIAAAIYNLFSLAAMISINLGVINLLPLPALDGGRFFILLIEVFRKKPMDLEKESMVHFVGFVLLMILMIVILFNDVTNIIG